LCGICGVFNYSNSHPVLSEELIIKMRDAMIHRGPDDAGVYLTPDRTLGLGQRRLSIIDLSACGKQPMSNEDGTVWIVFNGEIYNHEKLRPSLEAKGHIYQSHTDTETILHLYEEKGVDCVHDIEGMFAFAIWDSRKRRLFMARDRIGKKPLYYTCKNGSLIFGSEIKAILEHPSVQRDIDTTALYHYLTFFVTPSPFTLFKGISKLAPGYYMICDERGNLTYQQYWDTIETERQERQPEEYYINGIRDLLTKSIKKRMMSDVPFGVFLSGGIDSSTNVALMAGLMDRPVETFSVGFKNQPAFDEFKYARQVAREFKTNHHEIEIDQKDLMDYVPKLIYSQDEPIADWVCVPLYFVSKLARDSGVIVIQIGEGSDEIFFGYEGYMIILNLYEKYWKPYMMVPGFLRKLASAISSALPNAPILRNMVLREILRRAARDKELFWGGAIAFTETHKKLLMNNSLDYWKNLDSSVIVKERMAKIDAEKPDADFLERMIYLEMKHRLPELLLMRVDKITMSTSIEGRAPYLDQDLVKFAMNIPGDLKVKNGQTKYILKKAVEGIIPDNIIYRKKQGFGAPVKEWFGGEVGKFITDGILNSKIRERQLFNYEYLAELLAKQRRDEVEYSASLWTLFNLSKWYDYWIAGEKV
jgi:asparagine synthase (glutamine-hydrolysing)